MNATQEIPIFYFSGTGNSLMVAQWFAEFAAAKGISCSVADIAGAESSESAFSGLSPSSLIVVVSPVHGFNYPKITLDFIRSFPKATPRGGRRVVLMNTRGSVKVGRFNTPGLTGVAFILSSLILWHKGYRIIGAIPFDMPSNWISIHPAIGESSARAC